MDQHVRFGFVVVVLLFLAGAVTGCATDPGATSATGTGIPPGTALAALGARGAASAPAPREFTGTPALTDIHFDFDRYDIRPGDVTVLAENAKWMKANPNDLILIEGHCDERGTSEYNLALGERRAKATLNYLVALGVRATRITVISYGVERPLCTEHQEECWTKNRRAHFLVKAG